MRNLHFSKTEEEYNKKLISFQVKYAKNHKSMYDHIYNTWINTTDHTCKWQIFRNNPGFANTNSPLESFNSRLKTDFFNRIVRSIGGVLNVFREEIIPYLSDHCKKFKRSPRYVERTEKLALNLMKKNFKRKDLNTYSYQGKNNKYTIKLNLPRYYQSCFCDCGMFMKDVVCMHLVGFSWLFEKSFYKNYQNDPKVFASI
jgi:hypothetical protein